jgi:hypothetical protein
LQSFKLKLAAGVNSAPDPIHSWGTCQRVAKCQNRFRIFLGINPFFFFRCLHASIYNSQTGRAGRIKNQSRLNAAKTRPGEDCSKADFLANNNSAGHCRMVPGLNLLENALSVRLINS